MPSVDVREAVPGDADPLAAVYHNAYRENRELGFPAKAESVAPATVAEWIQTETVYVAEVDERLIGGVRLTETEPDRIKLSRLAVHDDWQGNGIGTDLLEHAKAAVRRRGVDTIWLTTPEEHPYLPAFYRARGYQRTGTYPLEYRDYDEVVLEKRLSGLDR